MIYELKELCNDYYICEMDLLTKLSHKFKYIKKGKSRHCCYHYAFGKKYTKSINELIYNTIKYCYPIDFKKSKKDDIVLFYDKKNILKHSAKIIKKAKNIKETIVRAKFGSWSIYEHKLKNSLKIYGSVISFWRRRK